MSIHVVFLLLILTLAACGGGTAQRTGELLDRDHLTMDTAELQGYYQQLSDQLARESRTARTLGKGGRIASGPGMSEPKADGGAGIDTLRHRWNEVRQELRRRDLSP